MKNLKYLAFLSLTLLALGLAGCSDDDENGPGTGNISITVSGLTSLDADITVEGPDGFSETVTGTTTLTDLALGDYTIIVDNVSNQGQLFAVSTDDSEQDIALVADETETITVEYASAGNVIGLIGRWVSAGSDVAPILTGPDVNIDSIFAEFRSDLTYTVESFTPDDTRVVFSGVYSQQISSSGGITTITINQSEPSTGVSEGIFQVTSEAPDLLTYEVIQTSPAIPGFSPPTVSGGFGSSAGGVIGTSNVQRFRRLVE